MAISKTFLTATVIPLSLIVGAIVVLRDETEALPVVQPPASWFFLAVQPPSPPSDHLWPEHPSPRGIGWQVIDHVVAHGVVVVNVATYRMDEATAIAHQLVDPLKDSYIEVLVYFRRPGESLAAMRVQWTPSGGYVQSSFSLN